VQQGLTLVHFPPHRKRFKWERGCIQGLRRGCLGGLEGHFGVSGMYFVSETAQVELKSGRGVSPCRAVEVSCGLVAAGGALGSQGGAAAQGLTFVHFSAQRKRFACDRGCI